jgi:hypothetical protein
MHKCSSKVSIRSIESQNSSNKKIGNNKYSHVKSKVMEWMSKPKIEIKKVEIRWSLNT